MGSVSKTGRGAFAFLFVAALVAAVFIVRGGEKAAAAQAPTQIVFVRMTDGYWQLWLMEENGEDPRQLTTSAVDKHSPSWCPGNDVIHFSTRRGDNVLLELATGTEHRQIPDLPFMEAPRSLEGEPLPMDVDVRRLLAEHGQPSFLGVTCGDETERRAMVKEIRVPEWMDEGAGVVIQQRLSAELKPQYDLRVSDLDDKVSIEASRVPAAQVDGERAISTSGATAFLAHESGGVELWQMTHSDKFKSRVTDLAGNIANPTWTHDGSWLIFDSEHDKSRQIYRSRPDGTSLERLSDGLADARGAVLSWPEESEAK